MTTTEPDRMPGTLPPRTKLLLVVGAAIVAVVLFVALHVV
jgi:hypothetical protein